MLHDAWMITVLTAHSITTKSSLLLFVHLYELKPVHFVADRTTLKGASGQEGEITLDSVPVTSKHISRISGYCEQSDLHVGEATVFEAVRFSVALRLPKSMTAREKNERVTKVFDQLGSTVLRTAAGSGTSVVCTIHQPSVEAFSLFDRLLLLKFGGKPL